MNITLGRRCTAEFIGTAFLLVAVVGSGIMAERLADGNGALALIANVFAIGAALTALILTFGPISGAHFNPAVTVCDVIAGGTSARDSVSYIVVQFLGAACGTVLANLMFSLPPVITSTKVRSGPGQWLGEFIAAFGLLSVIWGTSRLHKPVVVPFAVSGYIIGAVWFTSSTSFANPAVTVARTLSDTFTGIRPVDAPAFILFQMAGAIAATLLFRWLVPSESVSEIVMPHGGDIEP
jgi:glycerol uptake facilitator-like aquaporin